MEKPNWDEKLTKAISKYDFDAMKEAVKNGAKVDNDALLLHRVINRDRVDLLEYFCFSPELKEHYNINYEYQLFGENAPFSYAAMCGAINCLKFMLRDERVSHIFNMEKCAADALFQACEGGSIEVTEFLLSAPETKEFCDIRENNFKGIKAAISRGRFELITHAIMNWEYDLVKELMVKIEEQDKNMIKVVKLRKFLPPVEAPSVMYDKIFETRKLQEELKQNKTQAPKPKKI